MGLSLVGWSESVVGLVTIQALTGIPDDHVRVEGDNIVVPQLNKIVGEYAIGVDIRNVELASPSIRRTYIESIAPVEIVALPVFPPDILVRGDAPLPLEMDEQLTAFAGNSNAAAQQESVFIWLSDGPVIPAKGNIYTIEADAVAPATAYAWASANLVMNQTLPVGTYMIVGGRCEQATTIVWRLIFVGGTWRPGHLAVAGLASKDVESSRYGLMGNWGSFSHLTPPRIEFFGSGAGGAAKVYIDMIKIA